MSVPGRNNLMELARRLILLGVLVCFPLPLLAAPAAELAVAGWIERVRLGGEGIVVQAKLDTGADVSSLHAAHVRRFQRDGAEWVGFDVTGEDGRVVHFEQPLVRSARVRSATGGRQQRPVVRIEVCLGGVSGLTEVNLVDRSAMSERLLVGRSFLNGRFLVDSARTHALEPDCRGNP